MLEPHTLQNVSLSIDLPAPASEDNSPRSVFDMNDSRTLPSPRPAKKENKWSVKIRGLMKKLKSTNSESLEFTQSPKQGLRSASSENLLTPSRTSSPAVSSDFSGESAIVSSLSTPSDVSSEFRVLDMDKEVEDIVHALYGGSPEAQLSAVSSVRRLTRNSHDARTVFANAGAIEPLLSILSSPSSDASMLESTALALCNLSIKNKQNKLRMVDDGIMETLVRLLTNNSLAVKEAAVAVLLTLAAEVELKEVIGRSGVISNLVELLLSGTPQGKSDCIHTLYNLIGYEPNLQLITDACPFVALLHIVKSNPGSRISEKAISLLCAFCASENARNTIIELGGPEIFIKELELGSEKTKEVSVSALHLICLNSRRIRLLTVESGAVNVLLELSQSSNSKTSARSKSLLKILEKPGSAPMVLVSSQPSEPNGNNLVREMVKESMREAMHQLRRRARLLDQ